MTMVYEDAYLLSHDNYHDLIHVQVVGMVRCSVISRIYWMDFRLNLVAFGTCELAGCVFLSDGICICTDVANELGLSNHFSPNMMIEGMGFLFFKSHQ